MAENIKICNSCKQEKPFSAFSVVKPGQGDRNNLASRCKACRAARNLTWYNQNRERARANRKAFHQRNIEEQRAKARAWNAAHPERVKENMRDWSVKNSAKLAAKQRRREAKKLNAEPSWLTSIHHAQIQEMYDIADARTTQTGIKHHVDHVHPLQGRNFSGLHVPWNLQVLTSFENLSKKNKVPADERHLFWAD
jgi:hypothetical protein